MILKNTIRSLTLVLAASVSSVAISGILGVGTDVDVRAGVGATQLGAGSQVRANGQSDAQGATLGAKSGVDVNAASGQGLGGVVDAATGRAKSIAGTAGTRLEGASGTSGSAAVDSGASLEADAHTDVTAHKKKTRKAKQPKSSGSGHADAGVDVSQPSPKGLH
jgi:hypothetical protein